jgi:hypothetical protein
MKRVEKIMVVIIAILALTAITATADPTGPTGISTGSSSRYGLSTGSPPINAFAGNVTQLILNASSITQTWQGYFGNISGKIVLGNSGNKTLYDWNISTASGQVYASRGASITWTTINCTNAGNMTAEDAALGSTGKPDSVANTFQGTTHDEFFVGMVDIGADSCASTNLKDSDGFSANWQEVLLTDSGSNTVYTSLLNGNTLGYDGSNWDFQMLVGEDGHNGNTGTTPYFFWVELA